MQAVSSLFASGSLSECILRKGLNFVVWDRRKVEFWSDLGNQDTPLKNEFPRIFSLSVKKSGPVHEFGYWNDKVWVWDIPMRRPLFDWEKEQ